MAQPYIALQLYTVRDEVGKDYAGTLKKVKEIGYDHVEVSTARPPAAAELKAMLDDAGLSACSIHAPMAGLESDLAKWIDFAQAVGIKELICPYMPEEYRQTKEGWLKVAGLMNGIGARCREAGLGLSYHNHSFEFQKFDGRCALDLFYENTEPENVHAQIDTYWVQHGGEDPVAYIRKCAGRMPILHVKDMADDQDRSFVEIGKGILDWPAIDQAAREAGVECYCVEQDRCWQDQDPIASSTTSLRFLRGLLG